MTTYRKIHGRSIQAVTTDPSESVAEGQVWYNTNSDTFKSVVALEAFSSASPLLTTREGAGAFGTQTAAVICGGETPSVTGVTEEYNGTGFSAGGTMNTARFRNAAAGTLTAGISFGGYPTPTGTATETYNGTAWTTSPYNLNTGRDSLAGAGTQTSALAFGGGPGYKNNSEEYDGEGWSATPTLNTSRISIMGAGANAEECLAFGGATSSPPTVSTNATESWNGTSWTEVNNLNTARYGGYGAGTQTAAILAGGIVGPGTIQSATEIWDGTNWTSSPASLATARGRLSVAGSSTAAIAMAGQTPSITTATEEFNVSANVITAAAWASGGAAPSGTSGSSMAGNKNDAMMWGGDTGGSPPGWPSSSFSYNGSSWTSEGSIPGVRNVQHNFGAGHTDATGAGGNPGYGDATIEYNGSSWTAGGTKNHDNDYGYLTGGGPQTAGVVLGGGGNSAKHEDYNGTTWTERTDFPSGANFVGTIGSQTALLGVSGANGTTATWNGSAWTVVSDTLNTPREYGGAGGANSSEAYMFGGGPPTVRTQTELYNGTSWASQPNMANGRESAGGSGVQSSGLIAGSFYPGNTNVEEFTAETTSLNVKTLTQS
jgi:hypothetical protein